MKKTWSVINEVVNKDNSRKNFPEHFKINGLHVSNKQVIANKFNEYFIEIGPKLAETTAQVDDKSFLDYLVKPLPPTFKFKTVDVDTVIKAIDSLKPKTSSGVDRISNKICKAEFIFNIN